MMPHVNLMPLHTHVLVCATTHVETAIHMETCIHTRSEHTKHKEDGEESYLLLGVYLIYFLLGVSINL